jgi:dihydroorotase/N-acyl-D-amino-acid deacylase
MIALYLLAAAVAAAQPFDVVIAGGRVIDGTGTSWYHADIGINGDRITAIGRLDGVAAKQRMNAAGLIVAPGFIDIHSHAARDVAANPGLENLLRQGVTTVLDGQDGGSPLPFDAGLKKFAETPVPVNFGFFVGHGSIRRSVMGSEHRTATVDEIRRMTELARIAMLEGGFGLSTGLFYVPGNYARTEEVIEIGKVVGSLGGMHISHMRDEAAGILDSVRETIRIGEEGNLPTQITHHKIIGKANWGRSADTLRLVDEARKRGVDVTIDQYPYTASHTGTTALFPQWSLAGGAKALAERMQAPEQRAKIKAEVVRRIIDDRGGGDPVNVQFARCSFDPSLDGRTLADATRGRGMEPSAENAAEVIFDIQAKGGCSAIYHAIAEDDVQRILRSPHTMIGSDGDAPPFGNASPHPRSYGTFSRVLGRYVREKGVLSLEEAVRKMTGFPASRLKLPDRGLLRPGMKADVVVFDAGTIIDRSEFTRPHQYSEGMRHVFVNGAAVLLDGKPTGARPGIVLYGPGKR